MKKVEQASKSKDLPTRDLTPQELESYQQYQKEWELRLADETRYYRESEQLSEADLAVRINTVL